MAQGGQYWGLVPPGSARGLGAPGRQGPVPVSAARTCTCRGRRALAPRAGCVHACTIASLGRHLRWHLRARLGTCGRVAQARAGVSSSHAQRRSRSDVALARAEPPQACAGAHTRTRHPCQGPAGLGAAAGDSPGQGGDRGSCCWDPGPAAGVGGALCRGQGVPLALAPAATPPPPATPSLLQGLHMGQGQTPAKWAGGVGGVAFQSLRLEQTLLPPRRAVARLRPLTPARQRWWGGVLSPSPGMVGSAPPDPPGAVGQEVGILW